MSSERENLPANITPDTGHGLMPVDYDIAGNTFRVYYDAARHPIFVLDSTKNERKPNVLLVIPESDDRKWDEILTSDWNLDLETIRPRKDNKYQKLDIEYGDLGVYAQLVAAYENKSDITPFVQKLDAFRVGAVRRIALERLGTALQTVERAQNTIDQTNDTISDLNLRLKDLRAKLSQYKKGIGREPTKQSAAKILKSEAQIDTVNEKLGRAKKRLASARHRLVVAEDDVNAMRRLLNVIDNVTDVQPSEKLESLSGNVPVFTDVQIATTENEELITEQEAENMAEEDVKPLFNEDPEILDEEIAFKPIDFGVSTSPNATPQQNNSQTPVADVSNAPAPLSFTPPQDLGASAQPATGFGGDFGPIADVPPAPVLDSMRPVQDTPAYMPEVAPQVQPVPGPVPNSVESRTEFAMAAENAPVVRNPSEYMNTFNVAPMTPPPAGPAVQPAPAPMPTVAVAPAGGGFRPTSPIRGNAVSPVAGTPQKSKIMYYVMLVILIVLSVFTLWLYQRTTNQNIPELTTTTANSDGADANAENPFINSDSEETSKADVVVSTPEQDDAPVAELEPEPEPEPVPVVDDEEESQPDAEDTAEAAFETVAVETPAVDNVQNANDDVIEEPVVQPVQDTPADGDNPFLTEAVEKAPSKPLLENILPDKPIYNVSQQENMFVADPEYETDTVAVQDATVEETVCSDGSQPDTNGCCGGEVFTDMEDGTFACCQPVENGECFAPLR